MIAARLGGIAASPWMRAAVRCNAGILNVLGITDAIIIQGEGAKAADLGEATMEEFVDRHADGMKLVAAA